VWEVEFERKLGRYPVVSVGGAGMTSTLMFKLDGVGRLLNPNEFA
jgi:hypothetical protein